MMIAAPAALAQTPRVANAAFDQRAVSGSLQPFLDAIVRSQEKAAWIGYAVPAVGNRHVGCCGDSGWYSSDALCGPCYLEGRPATGTADRPAVKLEGDATLHVLMRVENRQVGRLSVFSPDCQLDAGGLPFIWLTGVTPADSIGVLSTLARDVNAADRTRGNVPMAVALHADAAADRALERMMAASEPARIRNQAAFWLGAARGERGYQILKVAVERDGSADFRRQATHALSQSTAPGALETLFQMAKSDSDGGVRGQALFWLAQKAGRKAIGALTDAIANDPESQVRERAVFALSQLPKDEGVPLLIQVARTNRDARVKQRAMFWLGQSKDARAVAFFEEILKGSK